VRLEVTCTLVNQQSGSFSALTNVTKSKHDAAMSAIHNTR
jgi:hypothetical protein